MKTVLLIILFTIANLKIKQIIPLIIDCKLCVPRDNICYYTNDTYFLKDCI